IGGGFVVAWQSSGQDGDLNGVFAQRYDADGNTLGTEFQVNTETDSNQDLPSIAGLADGGFIVVWQTLGQDGSLGGIYAQRYDANGAEVGGEFRVNSFTSNPQERPSVAALADGGFVVTWESSTQDGSSDGVYAQRYSADGTTITITADA